MPPALVVFDFDDTLFPTTALRAVARRELEADPAFELGVGYAELLAAWDAVVYQGIAGLGADRVAVLSSGGPEWVEGALQRYLPRARRALSDVVAGVPAGDKAARLTELAASAPGEGDVIFVGDRDSDEAAMRDAGIDKGRKVFVRVRGPGAVGTGGEVAACLAALLDDLGEVFAE